MGPRCGSWAGDLIGLRGLGGARHAVRNRSGDIPDRRITANEDGLRAPGIHKKYEVTLSGYRICTVDPFGVRESSTEAEEFTLVGARAEFPGRHPRRRRSGFAAGTSRARASSWSPTRLARLGATGSRPVGRRGRPGRDGRRAPRPRGPDRRRVPRRQAAPPGPREDLRPALRDHPGPGRADQGLADRRLLGPLLVQDRLRRGRALRRLPVGADVTRSGWRGTPTRGNCRSSWPTSTWSCG